VSQLDSRQRHRGRPEGLESQHRPAAPFDGAVVLLHDVVEVLTASNHHKLPLWIFPAKQSQSGMAWLVSIQCDLSGPFWQVEGRRLPEERLSRGDPSIRAEK